MQEETSLHLDVMLVAWTTATDGGLTHARTALKQAAEALLRQSREHDAGRGQNLMQHLAEGMLGDESQARLIYGDNSTRAVETTVRQALAEGARRVVAIPLVFSLEMLYPRYEELGALRDRLSNLAALHPEVDILFIGPPFDKSPAMERLIAALERYEPPTTDVLAAVVRRAFCGDDQLFQRFMKKLQAALPPDTRVVLRGSALTGKSYLTGDDFDARGARTSDIDLTIVGEEPLARWDPTGFFIPGVLTVPVSDEHPEYAPWINPARVQLQQMVRRPVTIQAMSQWFLDLRTALLDTPYLSLDL